MKRKIIAFFVSFIVVFVIAAIVLPAAARAAGPTPDGFYYSIDSVTGNATITSYSGISDVSIPDTINDGTVHTVTAIGNQAFENNTAITSVSIPASVTLIDNLAFSGCSSLSSVVFREGSQLNTIGDYAFSPSPLESITIPAGVSAMGTHVFADCTSLSSVQFAGRSMLRGISTYDFYNCSALTDISLPSALNTIGEYAFYNSGLTDVTIPAPVTSIGEYAFSQCLSLVNVDIRGDNLSEIEIGTFKHCPELTGIALPESVEIIGHEAFRECGNLASVTFGSGSHLEGIGWWAFAESGITNIAFPDMLENIPFGAFQNCVDLTSVTFGDDSFLRGIDEYAFQGCSLTEITLPESVSSVGEYAFENNAPLQRVTILNPEMSIGEAIVRGSGLNDSPSYGIYGYSGSTAEVYASKNTLSGNPINFHACVLIQFVSNGGTPVHFQFVESGTPAAKPSDIENPGYILGGWFREPDFINEWNFSDNVTTNMTLYAKWQLKSTYLKGINLTPGATLSPSTFSKTRYSYTVKLTEDTDSVTITPTPVNSSATIKINNVVQRSITFSLEKGHSRYIYIKVLMPGKTSHTYTLYVKRAKSTVEDLSLLTAATSEGAALPFTDKDDPGTTVTFDPDTTYYYLRLDENTPVVKITPAKGDQYQKIYIDGHLRSSRTYSVSTGHSRTCTIKVVAQNSAYYKTYKVYISRAVSTNVWLKNLYTSSSDYPITPLFTKDNGEYYVYLSDGRGYITLYAAKDNVYQKVKFDGVTASHKTYYLTNATGKDAVITVYAQASTAEVPITKVYTVHIMRAPAITSFSASPYYGSYPSISPGGENRLKFTWYQKGAGNVTISIKDELSESRPDWWYSSWQYIYTASANAAGAHTFEWSAYRGGPLPDGKFKAAIRVTNEFGTSSYKYLYFKILKPVTPTISASRYSITQGGRQYTKITAKWDVFTKVKVEVYDDSGVDLVATLLTPAYRYPDTRTLYWYGKYDTAHGGTAVPPGVYRIRVKAGSVTQEAEVTVTPAV